MELLHTRYEHGGLPVEVHSEKGRRRRFVLLDSPKRGFQNWRRLAEHLYGRPTQVSFQRYFGLASPCRCRRRETSVLDFFRPGIDLGARAHEVEKLLHSQWGSAIKQWELDYEEVRQDVMVGVLSRNQGRGAWNPGRGTFGTYVTLVCGSVVLNLIKREKRRRSREQVGIYELQDGGFIQVPVVDSKRLGGPDVGAELGEAVEDLQDWIRELEDGSTPVADLACEVIPFVYTGMRRGEIAGKLGLPPSRVGRALSYLRKAAAGWQQQCSGG
jgi:DNA-directed RNA polymerase specialized sigma24 family protein